jgi:hypothetical protein
VSPGQVQEDMPDDLSKSQKKALRDLIYAAHNEALRLALPELSADFDRWRRGQIDSIALADRLRAFDEGASREIYRRFTYSNYAQLQMQVAGAIQDGLIDEKSLSEEVRACLERWLAFYRSSPYT